MAPKLEEIRKNQQVRQLKAIVTDAIWWPNLKGHGIEDVGVRTHHTNHNRRGDEIDNDSKSDNMKHSLTTRKDRLVKRTSNLLYSYDYIPR